MRTQKIIKNTTKIENQSWLTASPLIGIDKRRKISASAPTITRHLADFVDAKRIFSARSRHDFAAISKIFRDAVFLTIAKCSSLQSFFYLEKVEVFLFQLLKEPNPKNLNSSRQFEIVFRWWKIDINNEPMLTIIKQ